MLSAWDLVKNIENVIYLSKFKVVNCITTKVFALNIRKEVLKISS